MADYISMLIYSEDPIFAFTLYATVRDRELSLWKLDIYIYFIPTTIYYRCPIVLLYIATNLRLSSMSVTLHDITPFGHFET